MSHLRCLAWALAALYICASDVNAQFTRIIQSSSYPDLVQQLRDKVTAPPPAVIASAEAPGPEPGTTPVARARSSQERPAPALRHVTGTTRDTDISLEIDAVRSQPKGASGGTMTPGVPAPGTPPGETRIEPGRPRTVASASPAATRSGR